MKALVFSAIRQLTIQQVPDPSPRPDQAVLKVIGTGICGSDVTGFLGHSPRRRPPLILGHEVVGTVVSLPPGDWPITVGDRVVANPLQSCGVCEYCRAGKTNICPHWKLLGMDREEGAFAEYVAVTARNLYRLPSHISNTQAVMIEPLANGVHLFALISRHNFGTLAIYGAGTQGILMLCLARLLGYRDIVVVDSNPARLEVAEKLGASLQLNPAEGDPAQVIREWTQGRGVDIGIDAAGVTATRANLIHTVRKGGEILLLGLHDAMSAVDFNLLVRNEQRLQGSYGYTEPDFLTSKRLLENGDVNLEPWTHVRSLEQGQEAFDHLVQNPGATLKIVLTP
ncbi:MAG TPA: alcohol dehydrogenase catalytic domain-containing protein [Chthonomonadales bacterium]|nr:alcohol dehydrogenase catalytic domain-containing protein [Chthonomonadales bacterium]